MPHDHSEPHQPEPNPAPFPKSYWVIPGQLLAGYYPGDLEPTNQTEKLTRLLDAGITNIACLTEEGELNPYEPEWFALAAEREIPVTWARFPIPDLTAPRRRFMTATLDGIDRALAERGPTYVHCWGGRGRTGSVVGCYLARHGIATGEGTITHLDTLRGAEAKLWTSPEMPDQIALVVSWRNGE